MDIKLSVTSKLDGIKSWSLNATETCPGSRKKGGEFVDACKGCYATTGFYRMQSVRKPRDENKLAWQKPAWMESMVKSLQNERYFRWFDSGDIYTEKLANKIYDVMLNTPHVTHWLPTRSYKFKKIEKVLEKMKQLPNVVVRYSSDDIDGSYTQALHGSTIFHKEAPQGTFECKAYSHDGKCNSCRACWDKSIPVIAYKAHGRKIFKIIKEGEKA